MTSLWTCPRRVSRCSPGGRRGLAGGRGPPPPTCPPSHTGSSSKVCTFLWTLLWDSWRRKSPYGGVKLLHVPDLIKPWISSWTKPQHFIHCIPSKHFFQQKMHKTQRNIFFSVVDHVKIFRFLCFLRKSFNLFKNYYKLIYFIYIQQHYIYYSWYIYTSCIIRLKQKKTKKKITITCKTLKKISSLYVTSQSLLRQNMKNFILCLLQPSL